MKILIALALIPIIALADPPRRVVLDIDQGSQRTVLLTDSCGIAGGSLRAYQQRNNEILWGCWGFDDTGIQILWQDARQTGLQYRELAAGRPPSCPETIACPVQPQQPITYEQFYRRYEQLVRK